MASKTLHSNPITFLDYTDNRKLEAYIASNLPTVQVYNPNTLVYTPDWSSTNLVLNADIYLDSKDVTTDTQTSIVWYERVGVGEEIAVGTGTSLTVSTNKMSSNIGIITYICKAEYQTISAQSQITFTRNDSGVNGVDGTSVTILGSYDTLADLQAAHPTGDAGDGYIIDGDLYVWSVDDTQWKNVGTIQGPEGKPGENAKSIILNAAAQVFKVNKSNVISPATISVTAQEINTTVTSWTYSTNGGQSFLSTVPNGVERNGSTVTITGANITSNTIIIKASDGVYSDTYTVYKVFDGTDGTQGDSGDSAPIAFLTNENITFTADTQGQITGTTVTSNVVAYDGITKVLPTIGEITGIPEGMTITTSTIDVSNEIMLSITVDDAAILGSALSNSGTISIPVISPISSVLSLSWSKINTGATGESGADAVTFQVYSADGYILSNDTPSITLQTFAYIGDTPIEAGATYQWYFKNEEEWFELTEEVVIEATDGTSTTTTTPVTTSYAEIHHTEVSFSCSYMCKMTFNEIEYVGVVTIDDKIDTNTVFTSKPNSYSAGDIWIVGSDYIPEGVEVGTVLKAQYTNDVYTDEDWVTATKYDDKISDIESDVNTYKQYISLDTTYGIKMNAVDENGVASEFSTTLSNTQLSFNQGDETVAYINNHKMYITEAEIESPLTVTGKYSGSTMLQAPTINLGDFSLVVESNGSLSIVSNL